jgi:DNA helicase-2/ATP-dependent DNA helicase PcrA
MDLNLQQREAVEHGTGPLLVIAGPGTGKTRVIVERILHLLGRFRDLAPENILALTYTEKAAKEMQGRARSALVASATAPHVATFHSFCLHVLKQRHFERQLLDTTNMWIFLRRRMEKLGLKHYQTLALPGSFLHDLTDFFSRCQDELIDPEEFQEYVTKQERLFEQRAPALDEARRLKESQEVEKLREQAGVFARSQQFLVEAGCSSFGSLIRETVRLWDREPELLQALQRRFRFVLVDEFQDANYGQVELLRRLVAPPYNIVAVGDRDQAIYRFRGAAHGAFAMFHSAFPAAKTIHLNINYRSTGNILRIAETVIINNITEEPSESRLPLFPTQADGAPVGIVVSPDVQSEAVGIANLVEGLVRRGRAYCDVAILYRLHSHRNRLVEELRRRNIPFAIRGLSLLSTVILRDLLAYLRLIHSWRDNISLTRALLARRWRFPEALAMEARQRAAKDHCSLAEALEGMSRSLFRAEMEQTGWLELRALVNGLSKRADRIPLSATLNQLLEGLGARFRPGENDDLYVKTFTNFLKDWEEKSETRGLSEFIEYFDYFLEAGGKIEPPEGAFPSNAVQLMTVHAAKGLEFPIVVVLGVGPRRFPHTERKPLIEFPAELRKGPIPPADIHLQEERRLFYVAITRAQERLFISSIAGPGKKPSRFVDEILSGPAVRGRDLEMLEVPPVKDDGARPSLPVSSPTQPERDGQARLFALPPGESFHPPLAAWAAQSPPAMQDGRLELSATAIETYLGCPLKFKFSHCLGIPSGPQAALTFGNVMHQAVRRYFDVRRNRCPSPDEVEEFYLRSWKKAGFEDAYQETAYQQAGREQLRAFVERHNALPIPADQVRMEQPFKLQVEDVVLEGRIDQILPLNSTQSNQVELVDYKTGRPREQKDADRSLQLSVYALAAREQFKLDPARVTFYNLTNNQAVSSVRSDAELDAARAKVLEVADAIRSSNFAPTPGYLCQFCDYVPICIAHEGEF